MVVHPLENKLLAITLDFLLVFYYDLQLLIDELWLLLLWPFVFEIKLTVLLLNFKNPLLVIIDEIFFSSSLSIKSLKTF